MNRETLFYVLCRQIAISQEHPRIRGTFMNVVEDMALRDDLIFPIRVVECMSICNGRCTFCLQAYEKFTYMFGGPAADETSAELILLCVQLRQNSAGGLISQDLATRLSLIGKSCPHPNNFVQANRVISPLKI